MLGENPFRHFFNTWNGALEPFPLLIADHLDRLVDDAVTASMCDTTSRRASFPEHRVREVYVTDTKDPL